MISLGVCLGKAAIVRRVARGVFQFPSAVAVAQFVAARNFTRATRTVATYVSNRDVMVDTVIGVRPTVF
jgi:hypothetical protein